MAHSPGWYAYMQSQVDKEERQKEYEAKKREWARQKAEREEWKREHMSEDKCPKCGSPMYLREGKYGKFYGCSRYPECNGTRKISKQKD